MKPEDEKEFEKCGWYNHGICIKRRTKKQCNQINEKYCSYKMGFKDGCEHKAKQVIEILEKYDKQSKIEVCFGCEDLIKLLKEKL